MTGSQPGSEAADPVAVTLVPGSAPSIITVDPRGIVVRATSGAETIVGAAPGALLDRPLADLLAAAEVATLHELLDTDPAIDASAILAGRRDDGLPLVIELCSPAGATTEAGVSLPARALVLQRWGGPVSWADDPQPRPPARTGPDHVLSHDARAAVRNARNFVGLFVRKVGDPPPELAEALPLGLLDTGLRALAGGDEILDRIVWYLRLEHDPLAMRALPLPLLVELGRRQSQSDAETWAETEPAFAALAEELAVTWVDGPGSDPDSIEVVGHHELLVWCLAELLSNARKFAKGPTEVTITATQASSTSPWVELAITNAGARIDATLADDAFALGRMLQGRGERPGVGLGLSLCRRIVLRHGGRIAFAADTDQTTVHLRLLRAP